MRTVIFGVDGLTRIEIPTAHSPRVDIALHGFEACSSRHL